MGVFGNTIKGVSVKKKIQKHLFIFIIFICFCNDYEVISLKSIHDFSSVLKMFIVVAFISFLSLFLVPLSKLLIVSLTKSYVVHSNLSTTSIIYNLCS